MDTILASIRRILNEDEVAPAEMAPARPEAKPADKPAERSPPKDDVLVLRETMMVAPEKIEPALPMVPQAPDKAPSAPAAETPAIDGLVAARTRAAAAQSFDALHEALRREEPPVSPATGVGAPPLLRAGGPSLEDLVRDELRGLLSTWLDVHLPGLVENLVRSEIEKLTRRS